MISDSSQFSKKEWYYLMTQTIIPRPVAWILSDNGDNTYNLAPFSYFNGVSSDPPVIMMSIGKKRDGNAKDTWRNISERQHFVVHIPSVTDAEMVTLSAKPFEFGESEVTELGLEICWDDVHLLPRLANSKVAFYCQYYDMIEVGNTPQSLVLGEIKSVYLSDEIVSVDEKKLIVSAKKLDPLIRLGGSEYASLGDCFIV